MDLLHKVKKMKEFTEELEDMLEECYEEEEPEFRGSYRKHWDEDDENYRDNLPTEVVIPWDVKDDDITYYLGSEYRCNVIDADVEEDNYV